MYRKSRRKCRHCKERFQPDYRNWDRQKFCSKSECKKVSRAETQKRWRRKPENRAYYVERTQAWRKENPDYWKRGDALQDPCNSQHSENKEEIDNKTVQESQTPPPLQDAWLMQHPFMIGLLATLTGHALQDDIARTSARIIQSGLDILSGQPDSNGDQHAHQTDHPP